MSIFNATAPSGGGGGLEYEEGEITLTASSSRMTVNFSQTHTKPAAFAFAYAKSSLSSATQYAELYNFTRLGAVQGGSNTAACSGRRSLSSGGGSTMTASDLESNYLTASKAVFQAVSNYNFKAGTYRWFAIWYD